jgi:hypothetical protein
LQITAHTSLQQVAVRLPAPTDVGNGVLTFIPGGYEQFQPSSESDAVLTITPDDPPVSTPEPGAGLLLLAEFLGFVTLRAFNREFKVRRW